jgi:adenine specific DNA methylase Mod
LAFLICFYFFVAVNMSADDGKTRLCRTLWQQSTIEAERVIKTLTVENQIVLDPFMGSGTTGIAALE